jgi:SAM-dependent MidA family methyltransferase
MTAAAFMDLALNHPDYGYYSTAARRSGRDGDFFTNVDVSPIFGETIAVQLAEMWDRLRDAGAARFDLVEVGAGDGRLAADIVHAISHRHPELDRHLRVTLVERSAAARRVATGRLAADDDRITVTATIPLEVTGVILANELLDALPVHVVLMTPDGLREVYVAERDGRFVETLGPLSTPEIERYFQRSEVTLEPGWRAEVGLSRERWIADAASALARGFLLLFDYGHEAAELYSPAHAAGTLLTYSRHAADRIHWLSAPGEYDLTAHVDLTSIRRVAERSGMVALGTTDQTHFLMALDIAASLGDGMDADALRRRLAAKTLLMPGGPGSTFKVLVFAKDVGHPRLRGLTAARVT